MILDHEACCCTQYSKAANECLINSTVGLAALTGVSTLVLLLFGGTNPEAHQAAKWLYVVWVVGMPLWFLGETAWYAPDPGKPHDLDRFKHLQENARSVWAGLSVAMAILLLGQMP